MVVAGMVAAITTMARTGMVGTTDMAVALTVVTATVAVADSGRVAVAVGTAAAGTAVVAARA